MFGLFVLLLETLVRNMRHLEKDDEKEADRRTEKGSYQGDDQAERPKKGKKEVGADDHDTPRDAL